MSMEDFIITVYCLIDELLKKQIGNDKLRKRGFNPALSDSEVITMEIIAEFLGVRHESARPLVAESAIGKAQPSAFRT